MADDGKDGGLRISTSAEALEEAALRGRAHGVSADGVPLDDPARNGEARRKTPSSAAEWAYQRLILYIRNFEAQLDEEHEVAMGFVDAGGGVMRIEGMGFFDPDIVTFLGTDNTGAKTQIIQHVTQLNVRLRALQKAVTSEAPRRIGFRLVADLEEDEAAEGTA